MVRLAARDRRQAFDRVEPVHGPVFAGDAPPIGKIARVAHVARTRIQEVGVEREDDVRLVDPVVAIEVASEREARACAHLVAPGRLVLVPRRLREVLQDLLDDLVQRRRGDRFGQDAQARALARLLRQDGRPHRAEELGPGAHLAAEADRLRAVGVVERKHRRLREDVRRAQARRMLGVALNLRRSPHVILDEHGAADARERHRGREEERPPRHELLGLPDVRHDPLFRLLGAGADAGERERRAHQLQELPARDGIGELGGLLGELVTHVPLKLVGLGGLFEAAPVRAALEAREAAANGGNVHLDACAVRNEERGTTEGTSWRNECQSQRVSEPHSFLVPRHSFLLNLTDDTWSSS